MICLDRGIDHTMKTSPSIALALPKQAALLAMCALMGLLVGCSSEKSEPPEDTGPAPVVEQSLPEPVDAPMPEAQLVQPEIARQAPRMKDARTRNAPIMMQPPAPDNSPPMQRMTAPQAQPMQQRQLAPRSMQRMAQPPAMVQEQQVVPQQQMTPQREMVPFQSMAAQSEPVETAEVEESDAPYDLVEVFYGTDRAPLIWPGGVLPHKYHALVPAMACGLLGIVVALFLVRFKQYLVAGLTVAAAASGAVVVGQEGWVQYQKHDRFLSNESVVYGKEQGEMNLGVCHVSIPKSHQTGSLESPSVLHWEFEEKQEDHVMLMEVKSKEEQEFFDMLRERVALSPHGDLLIFIHGYNVTFEDAARRTAQIAHDLEFQGVPVFFSWPSQGELLGYVSDRSNSHWTASHLKDFLLKVHQQSGAQSIHLIAHSMGNRAFGTAIQSLATDLAENEKVFNEVILAAPDVDARVFAKEIAPKLTGLSQHVTLYASKNDLALKASRAVNGYPRAGDVGANILILNGIDTIDVTEVDTSLLGHAYYGDNTSVISDIYALMQNSRFPKQRKWLSDMTSPGGLYWYFDPQYNVITRSQPEVPYR